jgi:hypothetical protein
MQKRLNKEFEDCRKISGVTATQVGGNASILNFDIQGPVCW